MNKIIKNPLVLQKARLKSTVVILCAVCIFAVMQLTGCKNDEESAILLTVSAEPVYSVQLGESPDELDVSRFIIVSEQGSNIEQQLEFNAIEGFTYEKRYEYILKVTKTVNDNVVRYSLVETVSKTKIEDESKVVLLRVYTQLFDYPGTPSYERMVAEEVDSEFSYMQNTFLIEDFEYENGFDYLLKVHKTTINMPPQTGMLFINLYSLIEIISKT